MAGSSFEFTKSATSGSYIEGKIVWSSTADNDTNRSQVRADIYVRKASTSTELTIPTEGTWSYRITINGLSSTYTRSVSVLEDWVLLGGAFTTVNHDADGSKSIAISGSITAPTGTSLAGHTTSGSKTVDLDDIPRATTIDSLSTASPQYFTNNITAYYTPKKATFYNRCTIKVIVNGTYVTVRTENLGQKSATQQTYNVTFSAKELSDIIYPALKDKTEAQVSVFFDTYSNSDYTGRIGTGYYSKTTTFIIPDSVAPTASLNVTYVNTGSWITGKSIYVAGLTSVSVELTDTPGTGATIKSAKVFYNNTGYDAETPVTFKLNKSGNIEFVAQVTDSRGRSATATKSITVLPYSSPAITSMQTERGTYNNGWTADENGQDVKVAFKTTLSLTDKGNTYSAAFKVNGASKTPSGTTTGLASGAERVVYLIGLSGEESHTLVLTATDSTGSTGSATLTIPTVRVTMEFNKDGDGIAFGKTSEKNKTFECAWDAEFRGAVNRIKEDGSIVSLDDTGWIDLGLSSAVAAATNTSLGRYVGCAYRVINGTHVYVAFNCSFQYANAALTIGATKIPAPYKPPRNIYSLNTTSGRGIARAFVNTTGDVRIDYVQNIASGEQTASYTVNWIDGYIDYYV